MAWPRNIIRQRIEVNKFKHFIGYEQELNRVPDGNMLAVSSNIEAGELSLTKMSIITVACY